MRKLIAAAYTGVSLLCLATPAIAQDAADGSEAPANKEEIVVTGTLIRGIAPGGSQAIGVTQDKIQAIGAVNTSDLVANVPQAGNFLGFVGIRGSSNFSLAVNRPSLRYLGNTSASGASTLLLLDGHRMPGMGITQSSPDLDAIAAGAIERVDIVTDGGSATYGSDAIGGVMNFITRKTFDGLEVKGNVGFADEYMQYNAGVTAGKVWDALSAYVSYDFSKHDELYGRDRDWSQSLDWVNNTGSSSDCAVGTIRANNALYALPGNVPGLGNRCDNTELSTFYPKEEKHSAFGRVGWDNGGPVSAGVSVYYVHRENNSDGGPLFIAGGSPITSANPFAAPFLAALPGSPASGQLLYNLSPAIGNYRRQDTTMEAWGVTPTVKWNIGKGWQLNALGSYAEGKSNFIGQILNGTPINQAIAAGTFNPFNLTAPGNAATIATALDLFEYGRAKHTLTNLRLIADGPLFALPAGDVRIAIGGEYLRETYVGNNSRSVSAAAIAALADRTAKRNVWSVFGELNVPLLGGGTGPFESLTFTAAGRYDHYSDFGNTFNPKLGLIFEPVKGVRLRGNWGRSFQAPGMSDIALSGAPNWSILPLTVRPFFNPAFPPPAGRTVLLTAGGTISPLSPQKAQTWSLGVDFKPEDVPGLEAGATYYSIDYKGVIGFPPIFNPAVFYRDFPSNNVIYTAGDTAMRAYFDALSAQGATNTAVTLANLPGGAGNFSGVYGVLDSRTQNLARVKTSGLDFYLRYNRETGFGNVYFDMAGTQIISFDQQSSPTSALVDQTQIDLTKFRLTTTLGANIGNLRAQATWNHSAGYATTATTANLQQTRVGAFNVINLYFQYKVPGESKIAKDLAFTLNVDNLFDKDPPLFRGAGNSLFGVANGFTLGRLVRIGVSKKF